MTVSEGGNDRGGRPSLVLASASPRRRALLAILVPEFEVKPADIDEQTRHGEPPADYVLRLAVEKALAAECDARRDWVIGSDTAVVRDGVCLGKPADRPEACEMLRRLSGRSHEVYSSVALAGPDRPAISALSVSQVEFDVLPEAWIKQYSDSGEPLDKAGAYAIQGQAAAWIRSLTGSYSGVVGLPLFETAGLLREAGILRP